MNSTSASLYGSRPRPGGVACSVEERPAHAAPNADNTRAATAANWRMLMTILTLGERIVSHLRGRWKPVARPSGVSATPVHRLSLMSPTARVPSPEAARLGWRLA